MVDDIQRNLLLCCIFILLVNAHMWNLREKHEKLFWQQIHSNYPVIPFDIKFNIKFFPPDTISTGKNYALQNDLKPFYLHMYAAKYVYFWILQRRLTMHSSIRENFFRYPRLEPAWIMPAPQCRANRHWSIQK
jgi:hypothetical protein